MAVGDLQLSTLVSFRFMSSPTLLKPRHPHGFCRTIRQDALPRMDEPFRVRNTKFNI